jgi:ABC-type multidrug transport system fused ATPase/permease subunit
MLSSDSSPKGLDVGSVGWQTAEVNTTQVMESQAFAFEQVAHRYMSKNRYKTDANSLHHSYSFENQNQAKNDQGLTQKLSIQDLESSRQSDNWPFPEQKLHSDEPLADEHGPSISFRYHPPETASEAPLYLASGSNDRYQSNQSGVVPTRPPAEVQPAPAEATYSGRMYSEPDRSLWSRPSQWSRNERSAVSPQNPDSEDENSTDKTLDSTGSHPACAEQQPSPKFCVEMCDQCNRIRDDVSFCPVCEFHYCSAHWDSQLLHQRQIVKDGVPHERTNPRLAKRVKSIIEPSWTDDQQIQHHRADEDTTWFGVLPDPNGLPNELLFHDFGRYESFMEQSTFNSKSVQFPSLLSFVGPTGSGKSTIVKALVKLSEGGCSKNENQTPVVGLTQIKLFRLVGRYICTGT